WDAVCFAALFGYAVSETTLAPDRWLPVTLAASFIQWLTVVSLALLLLTLRPRWIRYAGHIAAFFYVTSLTLYFVPQWLATTIESALAPLPSTWMVQVFQQGIVRGDSRAWHWLILIPLLLAPIPWALRRVRENHLKFLSVISTS